MYKAIYGYVYGGYGMINNIHLSFRVYCEGWC